MGNTAPLAQGQVQQVQPGIQVQVIRKSDDIEGEITSKREELDQVN